MSERSERAIGTGALLQVRDLRCSILTRRGEVKAVDGISFDVEQGQSLGIVGESGSGKTMTALTLLRLFDPAIRVRISGTALFAGRDLLRMNGRELRRVRGGQIGVVFQDPLTSLDPVVPVGNQIAEAITLHRNVRGRAARHRAIELMERVGIPNAARRSADLPHRFSGGMRQRIMIAMAISCEPQLLIADEATTALDATVQSQILALLAELRRDLGMATMVISHDLGVIAAICDTAQVMYGGRIVERAPVADLLDAAAHPYSAALIRLIPRLDQRRHHRLRPIPGSPPMVIGDAPGCRFAPRCDRRIDRCAAESPPITAVDSNRPDRELHEVACWVAGASDD
jgi:oligopeptide transport system ATP-binding protein